MPIWIDILTIAGILIVFGYILRRGDQKSKKIPDAVSTSIVASAIVIIAIYFYERALVSEIHSSTAGLILAFSWIAELKALPLVFIPIWAGSSVVIWFLTFIITRKLELMSLLTRLVLPVVTMVSFMIVLQPIIHGKHLDNKAKCVAESIESTSQQLDEVFHSHGGMSFIFQDLLAKHTNSSPKVLEELAKSPDERIRREVARNRNTPDRVLRILSKEKNNLVMFGLLSNPTLPCDILSSFKNEQNNFVREHADWVLEERKKMREDPTKYPVEQEYGLLYLKPDSKSCE